MRDAEYFADRCRADCERIHTRDGIGRISEKRLHRIVKSFVAEDPATHETPVGRYVADALSEGEIFEIQTKAFSRLPRSLNIILNKRPIK